MICRSISKPTKCRAASSEECEESARHRIYFEPRLRRRRGIPVATALAILFFSITGCSATESQPRPTGKFADSFAELLDLKLSHSDLNDFEREVYLRAKEVGRIAQADYDEAYARFSECMTAGGKPVELRRLKNGLYHEKLAPVNSGESTEQVMMVVSSCQKSTTGYLPEMFRIQQGNPELLWNSDEVAYRCLERSGLVPEGYSLEEYTKTMQNPNPGGGSRLKNMPFDFKSDDVQACLVGAGISLSVE